MLSRYDKPVRILPWEEVADAWAERLNGEGVNFDRVPKALRPLLIERGVEILPPTKGMGKDCKAAYDEWKSAADEGVRFSVKNNRKSEKINKKVVSLQNKNKESNERRNEETSKRDNDEQRQTDRRRVANDATRSLERNRDRSNIRMLEEGLATSLSEYSEYSERHRRTTESERLVNIAKKNGLFIPIQETKGLGVKNPKRTGESTVYINEENGKVYKVKDPYAKSAMKSGVQPEDVVYEHLVHNHLFPETAYTLEGISEEFGDVRIVLSQDLIYSVKEPTREQITEELAKRGLYPGDNYSFGNEFVSVTDVEGDNVLLGDDGTIYFIDPIINFKKPLREIIKGNDDIRFRIANDNQEVFVSNAEQAVKGVNQEKTTPQQWKAMIQSNGGLKAGEDKWLGLSEWLDEQATAKRSLTKQEVLDFIGENKIRIEEVEYRDADSIGFVSLKEEYDQWLREEGYDYAWEQLTDRYGDDAEIAFMDLAGELAIGNEEAAAALLGENQINSTRLDYTTIGLNNKREIALTVPTIESWNENDDIHFGDAGGGRAVAWVRFGETIYETIDDVQEVTEFHEPYTDVNGHDIYKPVGSFKSGDFVVYGKGRDGSMIYVVYINGKQIPVAHATLEEARNAMNEYYREHPRKLRKPLSVLVIDEIQSKRHQEGREQGYAPKKTVTKIC